MSGTVLENHGGISFMQNENQQMIADMIRKFGKEHIYPKMMEWDEAQTFPVDVFKKLGELGLMGVLVPTEYGGSGLSYNEYVTAIIELGKICGSIGLSMAAHNSLCTGHILAFGNEEQKKKYSFDPDDEEDFESKNVFYVAITRPKNSLHFMAYKI